MVSQMVAAGVIAWIVVCCVLAGLASWALHAFFAPPTYVGNLTVQVENEDRELVKGATVVVENSGSGITDHLGVWSGSVSASSYLMTVDAPSGTSDPPDYATSMVDTKVTPDPQTVHVTLEGWSSLGPWVTILQAVRGLNSGDRTARITYSFIPGGVVVDPARPSVRTVELRDYVGGGIVGPDQFRQAIRRSLSQWKLAFESVFNPRNLRSDGTPRFKHSLTLVFEEVAESSPPPAVLSNYRSGLTGDFRIGMYPQGTLNPVLAYAYGPNNLPASLAGDMLMNADVPWRLDGDPLATDAYSIEYVATHELGHVLGKGHHVSKNSVMYPVASTSVVLSRKFPGGLPTSIYERSGILGVYCRRGAG